MACLAEISDVPLFSYVGNRPLGSTDPTGMTEQWQNRFPESGGSGGGAELNCESETHWYDCFDVADYWHFFRRNQRVAGNAVRAAGDAIATPIECPSEKGGGVLRCLG